MVSFICFDFYDFFVRPIWEMVVERPLPFSSLVLPPPPAATVTIDPTQIDIVPSTTTTYAYKSSRRNFPEYCSPFFSLFSKGEKKRNMCNFLFPTYYYELFLPDFVLSTHSSFPLLNFLSRRLRLGRRVTKNLADVS